MMRTGLGARSVHPRAKMPRTRISYSDLVFDGSELNGEQCALRGNKTTFVWLCSHNVVKGIDRHAEGGQEYISPIRTLRRLFPKIHEDFLK